MYKNVELLAPAGTYEAFLAAVENGANAVYMGGKLFNARANASNFDIDELRKIVEYAHLRNVKIHITMNTLLDDAEISDALDFAYEIYKIGVDAVIVQDIGLAKVLHEHIPNLELHASTQLSTHNLEGVNELAKIGFSRVVLARELSIEEIKYIVENTDTEIEIFAHGAQCISYSGQCLMSSMIGDRSGNRGKCAQPCRLPYKLIKNKNEIGSGYLLSPKDLSTLEILKEIPNVASLKIEGRMKSPEYVATVIGTYRKYLDKIKESNELEISDEDKQDLLQIFNRGGFSKAYLKGKTGRDVMCYEKPKHWGTYVGKVTAYDGKRYITLDDISKINIGDGIEVWNGSNNSPSTIVSEIVKNKIGRIHGEIQVGDKVYKTSDKALNQKARETFSRGFVRKSNVSVSLKILKDENIVVKINDFEFSSNVVPEVAQNQSLNEEKIKNQFCKTGNTPFEILKFDLNLDDGLFLPISKLNEIRRNSFEEYEKYLISKMSKNVDITKLSGITPYRQRSKEVSVFFNILRDEYLNLKNVDNFYFAFKDAIKNIDLIQKFEGKKFILLPSITKANYAKLIKNNVSALASKVDGFVLSNIGQLEYFSEIDTNLIANYTFNTFNSYTIDELQLLGFNMVTLSPELAKPQINSLGGTLKREIIAYGNTCVMTSEYCPVGAIAGKFTSKNKCSMPCKTCYDNKNSDKYFLRDRMNMDFRILPDNIDCQSRIFNAKTTSIETSDLNVDSIRLDIIDEPLSEVQKIVDTHRSGKKLSGEKYTNGHLNRPV
ncbi:MAG: U32 family peptidase [Clostridia bacterium]|nr:U32 family peptidase [Clostridia bacterium]